MPSSILIAMIIAINRGERSISPRKDISVSRMLFTV